MGEAAPCLMRSVSQPFFASSDFNECDPLRALTTSISFGRFMTEPLDWERWSSFSHNRTLEDIQKHSRPGAVAEKKAFFEAHYKKIASKKSTKSPQKENTPPNHSPQTIITPPKSAIDETRENEPVFSHIEQEISSCKDVCSPNNDLVLADDDVASCCQVEREKGSTEKNVSLDDDDVASCGQVDDDMASCGQVESEKGSMEKNVSLEDDDVASCGQVDDDVAVRGQEEQRKVLTEKVLLEKHQLYQSCHFDKNKRTKMKEAISGQKKPEICSSKSKLQSHQKAATPPINQRKVSTDVTEKKRPALKFLHMSMNGAIKTKDTLVQKALNLKMSVNGVKKNPRVLQRPESISHSSVACTKKPTSSFSSSSTVPSSFSFRSEERAAKRKEFFQKLEEKGKTKETEKKIHPQPKLKTINENKKLRRSTNMEAKPCTNVTKVPSSSSMQKLGRKPTPKLGEDTLKPKNFIEINKKKLLTTSMVSLPTKKMSKK